jgi:pimeloyl-ACP methyl ester carboxylesterase
MENINIKILSTSQGPVEYLDTGIGDVVLSLHGAMGGYYQAQILIRTVGAMDFRYLSLSRPGYLGTSIRAGRTPEEQADLYAELLDLLNMRKVIVMAISGGGPSAIHFALRHNDKCCDLVLISTCGGKVENKVPFFFHIMTLLAKWPAFVNMMKKKTEGNMEKTLRRSVSDPNVLERTLKDAEVMSLYREVAVGGFYRMAERIEGTKNDIRVAQTRSYPLKDIAVPTLVVHGNRDPHVPFESHGKRLATEIPGAKLFLAEGGEHVTIFTHRNVVRSRVSAFLHDLRSSGS